MSSAKATIKSSIMFGLSQNAHITGAKATHADLQAKDIIDALFHPSVRWSIKEYLKELEEGK